MNNQYPDFDDLNFGGFHANPEFFKDPAASYRPAPGKEILSTAHFTRSSLPLRAEPAPTLQREIAQA